MNAANTPIFATLSGLGGTATLSGGGRAASLSALDGWIDICRTGTWHGQDGTVTLTDADLDELVAGYVQADPAPVVLGHPTTDGPAQGWVGAIRRVGDRLQARLERLDDGFRAAVEAGRYVNRSISAVRDAAGWRLRHLGFLGAALPAVDGLSPSNFAAPAGTSIVFSAPIGTELAIPLGGDDERRGWRALEALLRQLREWLIETHDVDTANQVISPWYLETLGSLGEPDEDNSYSRLAQIVAGGPAALASLLPDLRKDPAMTGSSANPTNQPDPVPVGDHAELSAERERLAAERAAIAGERDRIATERVSMAAERALQLAATRTATLVADARVLPAERPLVEAIFTALASVETPVTLAEADGQPTQASAADAFATFLSTLPKRGPQPGEMTGAGTVAVPLAAGHQPVLPTALPAAETAAVDPTGRGMTPNHVALAAQSLKAADPTGQMTISQAVRQIMSGGQ